MFNKHEISRNACQLYGGNGKGTVKLYRGKKPIEERGGKR